MDIDDRQFQFHSDLPSLQETSARKVGLNFWRHEISKHRSNIAFELPELFLDINHSIVISAVNESPLPSSIKYLIKSCVKSVGREICVWAGYHDYHVSIYNFATDGNFLEYFDQIVWRSNGTISYNRTAAKLLNHPRLDDLSRFKIACLFCCEDQVRKLWSRVSINYQINDVDFDTKPFVHYWLHILLNQLENFPLLHFNSVANRMIYQCGVDNWPAINYFWNQLDQDCQIERILHVFHLRREKFVDYFIPKLTEPIWNEIVPIIGEKLINLLIDMPSKHQHVIPMWIRIRNSFKLAEFIRLIKRIWTLETDNEDHDEDCIFCAIWVNSPDQLKEIALNEIFFNDALFDALYSYENQSLKGFPRNVAFLINVISSANMLQRIDLWNRNWHTLIKGTSPEYLSQLLEVCLMEQNRIVKFKNQTLAKPENDRVLEYTIELIQQRCYKELNQFLDFCYSSKQQHLKRQFKQRLLQFCISWVHTVYGYEHLAELDDLDKFIKDSFQHTRKANQYKERTALYIVARDDFANLIVDCEFNLIRNFLTQFISSPEMMNRAKRCILNRCRLCLNEGEILKKLPARSSKKFVVWSSPGFEEFLKWCSNGENYVVL